MILPPDAQRVLDMATHLADDAAATGTDPLRAIVDWRFAIGVRLKDAVPGTPGSRTGLAWLFGSAGRSGPG